MYYVTEEGTGFDFEIGDQVLVDGLEPTAHKSDDWSWSWTYTYEPVQRPGVIIDIYWLDNLPVALIEVDMGYRVQRDEYRLDCGSIHLDEG
ncbi:MAG: hypothetical protein F6J95_023860 [Leptolyngbya sp. SIO1E4]|nr:hypothetical protein [Leptolyngbya sp. SIO1E4]